MQASEQQAGLSVAEQERLRRMTAGLDSLPRLTRMVFLITRLDGLPYDDVAWRCGISIDEVTLRIADALYVIDRAGDGRTSPAVHVRRRLRLWRADWMRWRKQQGDRRLGLRRMPFSGIYLERALSALSP